MSSPLLRSVSNLGLGLALAALSGCGDIDSNRPGSDPQESSAPDRAATPFRPASANRQPEWFQKRLDEASKRAEEMAKPPEPTPRKDKPSGPMRTLNNLIDNLEEDR